MPSGSDAAASRDDATSASPATTLGLVVVDKEPGWTSHDVVARCRRIFGQRRIGHAGTLDPDASGVLLVGLGRFTRVLRFLTALPKSYEAEVVMGTSTTTLDASGEITGSWDMSALTLGDVRRAAAGLTGVIEQVPPMVSAVKVGGKRLHELARAGVEVDRAPRAVEVTRFDVDPGPKGESGVYRVAIDCSSGTYVRVLAADLGSALGGGAHLRNLRRTRVGSFTADEARPVGGLGSDDVLAPGLAVRDLPQVVVGADDARRVAHGLALDKVALGATGDGPWALLDPRQRLLAVYEGTATDRVVAACVLAVDA
jgi:tRNA pseudouridine55 synthase